MRRRSESAPGGLEQLESRTLLTAGNIALTALGSESVKLYGVDPGDRSGSAAHNIGDLNGDGYDDFLIGAFNSSGSGNLLPNAGESYVVFGRPKWNMTSLTLNPGTLDGTNGITLFGVDAGDLSGHSVARAGDVNGDGFDDLMIGADSGDGRGNFRTDAGETYVVFGKANWKSTPTVDLTNLDGTNGFTLYGVDAGDHSGLSVSGGGDVNGDGYDDILIGAPKASSQGNLKVNGGESYLVFGKANWTNTPSLIMSPSTLDGKVGVTLYGVDPGDKTGTSVSIAGDVNGDGFADVLIGAYGGSGSGNTRNYSGESYLVFGKANWSASSQLVLNTATLDGKTGVSLFGVDMGDQSGRSVSGAGDVNGDGYSDFLISAPQAWAGGNLKQNAGETYLVFGKSNWSGTKSMVLNVTTLNGTTGVTLFGADYLNRSGSTVSSAGDVNGDGFDDVLIAAYAAYGANNLRQNAGDSYVVFGKSSWKSTKTVDLGKLTPSTGLAIYGIDVGDGTDGKGIVSGVVSSAGDVNGDGFSDLVISAQFADGPGNLFTDIGESYLILGKNFTSSSIKVGTAGDDVMTGTPNAEKLTGAQGDDVLISNGGADILKGAQGDDTFVVTGSSFARIDGGNGFDTLRLAGAGINLDLTLYPVNKLRNIEAIDLRGSGANILLFTAENVLDVTGNSNPLHQANTLTVLRDDDDQVILDAGWVQQADIVQDNLTMEAYTQGSATLYLQKLSTINPTVTLTADQSSLDEDGGQVTLTATLSEPSDINVVVELDWQGPATAATDYSRSGKVILIPAGMTTGSVTLTGLADDVYEGAEEIVVAVTGVLNGTEDGVQLVDLTIQDQDHAPVFTTPDQVSMPENSVFIENVLASDADFPTQTITYTITGGADKTKFALTSSGALKFKFAHDFEAPTDENGDNIYEVQITANDGHGGMTVQDLRVAVADTSETGAELLLGGPDVSWLKGAPAISVMPDVTVSGDVLAGAVLSIQVDAAGKGRTTTDKFKFPPVTGIGTSKGALFGGGVLIYQVQLSQTVTASAIQAFLRGITFSTSSTGLAKPTRTMTVTLTDINQLSSTLVQNIHALKVPPP